MVLFPPGTTALAAASRLCLWSAGAAAAAAALAMTWRAVLLTVAVALGG